MLQHISNLLSPLFPQACLLCGDIHNGTGSLCSNCLADLPWNLSCCRRCAIPLPQPGATCGQCMQQPPSFTDAVVPLLYAHPVDFLVKQIKFHHGLAAARSLGELLARTILQGNNVLPTVIIPVPLHNARLRQRGFNQAHEIARPLSRLLGVPLDTTSCQRNRATSAQADLPLAQRQLNTRNAFSVTTTLQHEHVALVDDVMTSGQTVEALSRELLKRGVKRVSIWCVSRTGHQAGVCRH